MPKKAPPYRRDGPMVLITGSCLGCKYEEHQVYEWRKKEAKGSHVYCRHPIARDGKEYIGDTSWRTPDWCPLFHEPLEAAALKKREQIEKAMKTTTKIEKHHDVATDN